MLDWMSATHVPALTLEGEERALGFPMDACEHIEQIIAIGRPGAGDAIRPFVAILKEGL